MSVTEAQAVKLFEKFVEVCIAVVKEAHTFIGTHDLKRNPLLMGKYPGLSTYIFYDDKYFNDEYRDQVPFLK
jgi:hypothetical protein